MTSFIARRHPAQDAADAVGLLAWLPSDKLAAIDHWTPLVAGWPSALSLNEQALIARF